VAFHICIKTDKSLPQLATEICQILSLPPFHEATLGDESYCQFEMLGMLILVHFVDEEDRAPETLQYPYAFDLQMSFSELALDTDSLEMSLQPYFAQLLSARLGLDTAYQELQQGPTGWQVRHRYFRRNPRWQSDILYGEKGWEPAVVESTPSAWRLANPFF
jgi:hypothetical protein